MTIEAEQYPTQAVGTRVFSIAQKIVNNVIYPA